MFLSISPTFKHENRLSQNPSENLSCPTNIFHVDSLSLTHLQLLEDAGSDALFSRQSQSDWSEIFSLKLNQSELNPFLGTIFPMVPMPLIC